jgi:hypothetical protein
MRAWGPLLTVAVVAAAGPARAASVPPALLRAIHAPEQVAYAGEQLVATWTGRSVHTVLVRVEHDPDGWTRLEYRPVGLSERWVVLRRGREQVRYDPVRRTGVRTTAPPPESDELDGGHLSWLLENYRVEVRPTTWAGRPATAIRLRPIHGDRPERRMLLDDRTGLVLRSERLAPGGRLGELAVFVALDLRPRGWRAESGPPPDLRVTIAQTARPVTAADAARALGGALSSVSVPAGFHPVGLYLTDAAGPVVQAVYSDGVTTLVIYQRPGRIPRPPRESRPMRAAGGVVWVQSLGLRTLVHWAHAGRLLTAVGEVSPASLVAAAERSGVAAAPRLWDHLLAWLEDLL